MKRQREILAFGLSAVLLVSLLAFAQSASAGEITLTGPDQTTQPDTVLLEALVELHQKGAADNYSLVITGPDGENVNVTIAPNGTVLDVQPQQTSTVNGSLLRDSLNVTQETGADTGGGVGYGEAAVKTRETVKFLIRFDSEALAPGSYTVQMSAIIDNETVFTSNELGFAVNESST